LERWQQRLALRLDDAALPWPNDRIVRVGVGSFASVVALSWAAGGLPLALVSAIALVVAGWVALESRRGRAAMQIDLALPGVLEATARSLRSGTSLRIALSEASTHAPARLHASLSAVVVAAERGVPLVEALDVWAATLPGDGVRLSGAALALSAELGGAAARSLDGVAATLRDRNAVRREVRALSSQARASAVVIGVAPVGFAVLTASIDRQAIGFLVGTPAGISCLVVGVVLDALGAAWMHRLAAVQ
jgi:tight adherence protein B